MEKQGCFVWDRAALCVRTGVCVCCGGLTGSNHQKKSEDGCDFFVEDLINSIELWRAHSMMSQ